jgi:hypothetical protein
MWFLCHFEEREIFAVAPQRLAMRYGATCEDFSFVEMTRLHKKTFFKVLNFEKGCVFLSGSIVKN